MKRPRQNQLKSKTRDKESESKSGFWKDSGVPFILCFGLVSTLFLIIHPFNKVDKLPKKIAIVLSPHYDDAVLSLGGFMAEQKIPVIVATFFSGKPKEAIWGGWDLLSGFKNSDEAVTARNDENLRALRSTGAYPLNLSYLDFQYRYDRTVASREIIFNSIKKNLETILAEFSKLDDVSIYGPSEFGLNITHPDHKILHDAFLAIVKDKLTEENVHFFFYEDFPYTRRYNAENSIPVKTYLEKQNPDLVLNELPILLTPYALQKKIIAVASYISQFNAFYNQGANIETLAETFTKNRCPKQACEVVYEILKQNQNVQNNKSDD